MKIMKPFVLKVALLFLICLEISCSKSDNGDAIFNITVSVNDAQTALAYKKIYCVTKLTKDVQRYAIYSEVTDNNGIATFQMPARTVAVGFREDTQRQDSYDCQAFFVLLNNDELYYTKFYVQNIDVDEEREYNYNLVISTQQKPPLIEE